MARTIWTGTAADGRGGQDYGSHGSFDGRCRERSLQLWASQHHVATGAAAVVMMGAATAAAWALRR